MWVRGLKHIQDVNLLIPNLVASYVGAWIETQKIKQLMLDFDVASYVGAWIETQKIKQLMLDFESHPMWVRGLKRLQKRSVQPAL